MSSYWLVYRGTALRVRRGDTTLGRSPYCTILVTNGLVSREHACIRFDGTKLSVEDLSSLNGTTVNSERIDGRTQLSDGDVIGIGSDELRVKLHADDDSDRAGTDRFDGDERPTPVDGVLTVDTALELVEALLGTGSGPLDWEATEAVRRETEHLIRGRGGASPLDRAQSKRLARLLSAAARRAADASFTSWCAANLDEINKQTTGER